MELTKVTRVFAPLQILSALHLTHNYMIKPGILNQMNQQVIHAPEHIFLTIVLVKLNFVQVGHTFSRLRKLLKRLMMEELLLDAMNSYVYNQMERQ
jgi:hypothetical protein